jgi:hypothetical protein
MLINFLNINGLGKDFDEQKFHKDLNIRIMVLSETLCPGAFVAEKELSYRPKFTLIKAIHGSVL